MNSDESRLLCVKGMLSQILDNHPATREGINNNKRKGLATEAVSVVRKVLGVGEHNLKDWFVEYVDKGKLEKLPDRINKIPRL